MKKWRQYSRYTLPMWIAIANILLWNGGAGHTVVIHSEDPDEIHLFSTVMAAGRILINTPAMHGILGETTKLPVSFMQACGSFGRNNSTDPLTWRHLVNIKRVAHGQR